MGKAMQAYVILGNGDRVESDLHVISDKVANDAKWIETIEFMEDIFQNFSKMDTLTLNIDGKDVQFQTKFLASAGMSYDDSTEEPTVSDEEALGGIHWDNPELLKKILNS